ncbi:MAG: bifunctional DNA-formamidopyrimidine glycosylase/DNA-(apurinic or apyrimidinic site) lyase [Candidatus Aminicenantales bacterium]
MPELPEVETIVRGLGPRLAGLRIESVRLLDPSLLRGGRAAELESLKGAKILGVRRRGKMILIDCEGGRALLFHLKMTGLLLLEDPAITPGKHARCILKLRESDRELRFHDIRKFGFLRCLASGSGCSSPELDALGPEPLALDPEAFARLFAGRRGSLKPLLLNQRFIAGIGNIYADEILHRARLHPRTPVQSLDRRRLRTLRKAVISVLEEAVRRKGSSIRDYADPDGRPGEFQEFHRVYGREGEPCRKCGTAILRIRVGGRSSFFCPSCQPREGAAIPV